MRKILLLYLISIGTIYSQSKSEQLIFENHIEALSNYGSTYQIYTVVFIDDGKNNLIERCLTGSDLMFALQDEWNLNYEDYEIAMAKIKSNKVREFKFKTKSSIDRINRVIYSKDELNFYRNKIKFDSILKTCRKTEHWSYYHTNEKEQLMMAHLFFKEGIQTGTNECFGGETLDIFNGY